MILRTAYNIIVKSLNAFVPAPEILSMDETLDCIIKGRCSVSRFGDGEIKQLMSLPFSRRDIGFQKSCPELERRLRRVLARPVARHLNCLPHTLTDQRNLSTEASRFWKGQYDTCKLPLWLIAGKQTYGDTQCSRPYMDYVDRSHASSIFEKWKQIWQGKDIFIVEGEYTRLGVGSDLFEGAKSLRRLLAPATNAFSQYSRIFQKIREYIPSPTDRDLILISLGPTASVLAYDLANTGEGYQAIDIGHIDVEYTWFQMGAATKMPIPGKWVNEAGGARRFTDTNMPKPYLDSIICRIE